MNKTFKELGFKAGDRVRCVAARLPDRYKVGAVYRIRKTEFDDLVVASGFNGYNASWEPVTPEIKTIYEVNGKQYDTREEAEEALVPVVKVKKYITMCLSDKWLSGLAFNTRENAAKRYPEADRIDRIELLSDGSTRIIQDVKE